MIATHQITSGRARLAVEVAGNGDPVVFLHAAVCDSRMWDAQLDAVGATHKAIAYDRRGFGKTVAEKRSEERRVGKACVSTCRARWSAYNEKKNENKKVQ